MVSKIFQNFFIYQVTWLPNLEHKHIIILLFIGTGPWVANRIGNLNSLQIDNNADNVELDHKWKSAAKNQLKLVEGNKGGICNSNKMLVMFNLTVLLY